MAGHQRLARQDSLTIQGEGTDMDLLERYLDAVAAQLSKDTREDIIA